jgi:hypothetical protein
MANTPTLTVARYVEVGTYIGQFFLPGAGTLPNEARVPCLVGRGDRLLQIRNNTLRRSFVYDELLAFSSIAPFIASMNYPSDGNQSTPTVLRTGDGVEIPSNKWNFILEVGEYKKVQISDAIFSPVSQYYLSYQSTSREVLDPIPVITIQSLSAQAEIREIQAIGVLQDQPEYEEYVDFYGNYDLDPVAADTANTFTTTGFSQVSLSNLLLLGTGTVVFNSGAMYTHQYDRLYELTCTTSGGISPARTATFTWTSTPLSYGNAALPAVPLNPAQDAPTFTILEGSPSMTQILENGVVLDFDFGAANFNSNDIAVFQGNGPGIVELDPLNLNTNQYSTLSGITPTLQPLSTGSLSYASLASDYTMTSNNLNFRFEVISVSGSSPNRSVTFVWAAYGTLQISGSFIAAQASPTSLTQTLGATGIRVNISFGATHFVVGDAFNFQAKAPRYFVSQKESVRNTNLSVGNVTYPSPLHTIVPGSYLTDTPEGRYGAWQSDNVVTQGRFNLPNGVKAYARNTYLSALVTPSIGGRTGSAVVSGDKFSYQTRFLGTLDFSLEREETQTFANPSEISTDITGEITGSVGARFISLNSIPTEVISVKTVSTSANIMYSPIAGTSILIITDPSFSLSTGDLIVLYRWRGKEPSPGQDYFLSARYLRPESFYNKPILFLSLADAQAFLAPSTVRNDLYIGASIAYDYPVPGLFAIQVRDAAGDGNFTKDDFKTAINAFLQDRRATDLVVLNFFNALPDQLQTINIAVDPFELHESMTWIGAPIGTPVGSEIDLGSLVFLSRKTLAVYGQSPAHGTRVLVSPTRATRVITLEDKSSTTVTLDGSFVACAMAGLNASFSDPKDTLLMKQITSFSTMQTYTIPENLILGGNNIIYFNDEGSGIYRIKEDITTDVFSSDCHNINQMVQKQYVTRDIRRTINNAFIGMVFPTAAAGVATLTGILASRLKTLEGNIVGRYQDANGNLRQLQVGLDTVVFRDQADPTIFHIGYNYFLATTAKRVFGLFTVNLPNGFPK